MSTANSRIQKIGKSHLFVDDLDLVIHENAKILESLGQKTILIFGGTGFVGKWLVATLLHSQKVLNIEFEITIVTRSRTAAEISLNVEDSDKIRFIEHNLDVGLEEGISPNDIYICGSTPSVPKTGSLNEQLTLNTSKHTVEAILKSASLAKFPPRVINLSSGAVLSGYGEQKLVIAESGVLTDPLNYYSKAKIEIEEALTKADENNAIILTNAHLFTFAGPHISLLDHFAIGNFMFDSMVNKKITIRGNPETTRSYMYPTDLVSVLLRTIVKEDIPYLNVGSDSSITIDNMASKFSDYFGSIPIEYSEGSHLISHYVPETTILQSKLGVNPSFDLESIISRWHSWLNVTGQAQNL